jgi:3-oxoacyl-[acyl-carrier protein] reductase
MSSAPDGLDGARVVITAASQGLGRAIATEFGHRHARIVIGARSVPGLEATADLAVAAGARSASCGALDFADAASVDRFMTAAVDELGAIDALVVNTGGPQAGGFEELDDGAWQRGFELVVMSAVRVVRAALPALRRSPHASIVHVLSTSAKEPTPGLLLSNALRPAVAGLAKSLADTLAPEGIRVNCVLPAAVRTARVEEIAARTAERAGTSMEAELDRRAGTIPLRRLGVPSELARAVVFLASPDAGYITGSTLPVDGGATRSIT